MSKKQWTLNKPNILNTIVKAAANYENVLNVVEINGLRRAEFNRRMRRGPWSEHKQKNNEAPPSAAPSRPPRLGGVVF